MDAPEPGRMVHRMWAVRPTWTDTALIVSAVIVVWQITGLALLVVAGIAVVLVVSGSALIAARQARDEADDPPGGGGDERRP